MSDEQKVPVIECRPGLFVFGSTLGFRTEYTTGNGAAEAYVVESGEMFWGGTSSPSEQVKLLVEPVSLADAAARLATPRDPGAEPPKRPDVIHYYFDDGVLHYIHPNAFTECANECEYDLRAQAQRIAELEVALFSIAEDLVFDPSGFARKALEASNETHS